MISHKKKFVFIHIPKTGGKSVRTALRPFTLSPLQRGLDYLSTRIIRRDIFGINAGGAHVTACATRDAVGQDLFDNYFVFSFVRNPWALVVSEYYFIRKRPGSKYFDVAMNGTLDDYLDRRFDDGVLTQLDYLRNKDGRWMVDFVGLVENFNPDFSQVCQHLAINTSLPHKNRTRHSDYREEHSDESRAKVAEYFANDIAVFGYVFDEPNKGKAPCPVGKSLRR